VALYRHSPGNDLFEVLENAKFHQRDNKSHCLDDVEGKTEQLKET
jgi:hypothetical protein